jgi:aminopeptidase N
MILWMTAAVLAQGINLREPVKHPFGGGAPIVENPSAMMQSDWDVQHYEFRVNFDLQDATVAVSSGVSVKARTDSPGSLLLNSDGPEIKGIWIDDAKVDYQESAPKLWVDMPEVAQGEIVTVWISSTADLGEGEGLGIHWDGKTLFSFHEPQGARSWLVSFDDPADKATLDWHVRVDSDLVVAANGTLQSQVASDDGKTAWHFAFDELIPTYLMVVHASGYDILEDETVDGKPIRHYIQPGTATAAWDSFEATPAILDLFSTLFGDYPWASYGHAVAPFGGAMEHTTMTTFGSGILGGSWGEIVNAHEVGHHWFGNYITLAEWPEIWLNEGFASYTEVLWYEESYGDIGRRQYINSQVDSYFNWQQYEGISPVYNPNYLFGGAVYDKGSVVLDMLRSWVGDDAFFESIQRYVDDFAHGIATTSDLEAVFERVTGLDLQWFFDQWVYRAGDPIVAMGVTERVLSDGSVQLDVVLSQETDDLWRLPIELHWVAAGQAVQETVFLESAEQVFSFCSPAPTSQHTFDPNYLLLLEDRREQAGPDVPVICAEDVTEPEDTGIVVDRAEGQESLTVGGCNASTSGPFKSIWLGLGCLPILLVSRRRRASKP